MIRPALCKSIFAKALMVLWVPYRLQAMQAHSLPISIPQQMMGKGGLKDKGLEGGFMPPHQFSLHAAQIGQSVPLSSSSRLRTRNKLLQSTGFLPTSCTHTEGFMVGGRSDSEPYLPRAQSETRLQSLPAEMELHEAQSEPHLQINNLGNSNSQFLRVASKVSIPASIAEILS